MVIEVDGQHQYAKDTRDGSPACPRRYGQMVKGWRSARIETYRRLVGVLQDGFFFFGPVVRARPRAPSSISLAAATTDDVTFRPPIMRAISCTRS